MFFTVSHHKGSISDRRGEPLALFWTDLDVDNQAISVTKQVNRINGKLVVRQSKTQNLVWPLAILQQAVYLLITEHQKHPSNPDLSLSPKTGKMFDPDSFRHTHDEILKVIEAKHIRFYDLHHTLAEKRRGCKNSRPGRRVTTRRDSPSAPAPTPRRR